MESFSRRALHVIAALGAGTGAAYVVLSVIGPLLVAATMPGTGGGIVAAMGALLVGLLVGSGLAVLLAGWAGLAVTVVVWRWVSGGRSLVA